MYNQIVNTIDQPLLPNAYRIDDGIEPGEVENLCSARKIHSDHVLVVMSKNHEEIPANEERR
jgi:hypothetical protein